MSAYDQWKILITQGNVTNPHDPSLIWPSSKIQKPILGFLSGRDGESPHIGENGNWYIGNKDTKIKAIGKDGKDGINGKDGFSAYELWKQSVAGGNINWPKDQTTMEHFFLYLKGKDGENGITPHVGEMVIGILAIVIQISGSRSKGEMVKTEHPLILVLMETGGSIHPIQK